MKLSNAGLDLIKKFESCRLIAYKAAPTEKYFTIGWGHYGSDVKEGMKITQKQADDLLAKDCERFEKNVNKYHEKYKWNQNEYDALVSFAFNIGSIDQLTGNGSRDKETISNKMLEYNKSGGKVLAGLVRRRKEEKALFDKGVKKMILQQGSKGPEVNELQKKLKTIGYETGVIDGIFGANTKKAVVSFQKDAGLKADGIAGANTEKALENIKVYSLKADANTYISKNFKVKEFACQDKTDTVVVDAGFIQNRLQQIRDHFNSPITLNSAYRTQTHNKRVGGSSNSFHVKGRAFDIVVKGKKPSEVAEYARSIGINGVIEYNTFVHVDSRPQRYWARNDNGKIKVL